jgi:hypothetical protein
MKKTLSFLFLLLYFSTAIHAQGVNINWANSFIGTSNEGHNILADSSGNVYVNGWGGSGSVDVNPHPIDSAFVNGIYLSKFDSNGNYVWSFSLGPSMSSMFNLHSGMCFDESGNIILAGSLNGKIDFDPSSDSLIADYPNGMLFVAKYTPAGALIWANTFAASATFLAGVRGVDVDANGNIFVGGLISGSNISFDFDPSANTALLTTGVTGVTFFMAKYNSSGSYQWANMLPSTTSSNSNRLTDLAIDSEGDFFITGEINAARDFDPSPDSLILTSVVSQNSYLAKYDTDGNLLWANVLAGYRSFCRAVETDLYGNVFIAGEFRDTVDFDPSPNSFNLITEASSEAFVAKYSAAGDLIWAKSFKTVNDGNDIRGMKFDKNAYLYISGYFQDTTDFDPSAAEAILLQPNAMAYENYVAKLDEHGNYIWAIGFANSRFSFALDVAVDAAANVYATGIFRDSSDFDPSANTYQVNGNFANTGFVAKFSPCYYTTGSATICQGDTLFASTRQLTDAGIHLVSFINAAGCDSVANINLAVNPLPDNQISVSGNSLAVTQPADSYQWIDCNTNVAIPNEDSIAFTATASGSYAVDIKLNNCTVRSPCESITVLSIAAAQKDIDFKVYPNPASSIIHVEASEQADLKVYNSLGQLITQITLLPENSFKQQIALNPGIYFVNGWSKQQSISATICITGN